MRPGESGSVSLILRLPQAGHYHWQFEWFVRSVGRRILNKYEMIYSLLYRMFWLEWLLVWPWQDESWHLWRKPNLDSSLLWSHCTGPDTSSTFLIRTQNLAPGRMIVCSDDGDSVSKAQISHNGLNTKFIPVHKFWGHQNRHRHLLLQWAQEHLSGSPQSMALGEVLRQGWGQRAPESHDIQPPQTTLCPQCKWTYSKTMFLFAFLLFLLCRRDLLYVSTVPVSNHPCTFTLEKSQESGDVITLLSLNI